MPSAPPVYRPPGWKVRKPFANSRTAAKRVTGRKLQDRNLRIKTRDMFTCQGCGLVTSPRFLQVDHKRPLAEGGTEDDSNLQSLCIVGPEGGCHGRKSLRERCGRPRTDFGTEAMSCCSRASSETVNGNE